MISNVIRELPSDTDGLVYICDDDPASPSDTLPPVIISELLVPAVKWDLALKVLKNECVSPFVAAGLEKKSDLCPTAARIQQEFDAAMARYKELYREARDKDRDITRYYERVTLFQACSTQMERFQNENILVRIALSICNGFLQWIKREELSDGCSSSHRLVWLIEVQASEREREMRLYELLSDRIKVIFSEISKDMERLQCIDRTLMKEMFQLFKIGGQQLQEKMGKEQWQRLKPLADLCETLQ